MNQTVHSGDSPEEHQRPADYLDHEDVRTSRFSR